MARRKIGRISLMCCTAAALATLLLLSSPIQADEPSKTYTIPPQDLGSALREFARLSNREILFSSEVVKDKTTKGVVQATSNENALTQLLAGTGLIASTSAAGQILIVRADAKGASASPGPLGAPNGAPNERNQGSQSNGTTPTPSAAPLEEILVTAQKRSERLQDVPVPVTVLDAATLAAQNQVRLQDYYSTVPGLSVAPAAVQGAQFLAIRGITTGGGTNPTVGITVDDVPYGSSTNLGGGSVVPDIDPSDLARIEVLRGPQGTLYGASSMGGLLKFVTVDPSTDAVSGRVEAGLNSVRNGDQLGYNVRGSVNVPLSDTWAIRASGFTRQDPGYIDNPVLHINGLNEDHFRGGRLSALWKPSEAFSLKLSALYQQAKGDGGSDVDVPTAGYPQTQGLGDLQQNYVRGIGGFDRQVQAYSATLNAKLGTAELTSLTGFNLNSYRDTWDYSFALGGSGPGSVTEGFYGVAGAPVSDDNKTRKFTQEIRLSMPFGQHFEALIGAFYTHETTTDVEIVSAADPQTGRVVADNIFSISFPTRYTEYAGFADLTYHVNDEFDIQIGGRESHIEQSGQQTEGIGFLGVPPQTSPEVDTSANAFTYLVTPRLKLTPDLMVYARFASGYRAGGPNLLPGSGTPAQYAPDKTQNYELGVKGDFFSRMLSIDASVYYIDWKDIQLGLYNPTTGLDYTSNGSRARSDGVELSATLKPLPGLTIAAWVVYNDAVLTQALPPTTAAYGQDGDRLPYSSRFSGNLSIDQEFPLGDHLTGFVGSAVSYVGDRKEVFGAIDQTNPTAIPPRQDLPTYAKLDLRAGVKRDSWTANLYVNNVADRRGLLSGGSGEVPPFAFIYIQPRVIGLSFAKTF